MTVHGSLLAVLLAGAAAAATWGLVGPDVDPRRVLGWLVGAMVLACGITWMINV